MEARDKDAVVVTGLGVVSPLGNDPPVAYRALLAGRGGCRPFPDPTPFAGVPGAGICALPRNGPNNQERSVSFALWAARQALEQAGHPAKPPAGARRAVVLPVSKGELLRWERILAHGRGGGRGALEAGDVPLLWGPDVASRAVARWWGGEARVLAPVAACATGTAAVGLAAGLVEAGEADVALAGASEAALTPLVVAAFRAMGVLAPAGESPAGAVRPFAADRDGFLPGEGAAVLVLEPRSRALARGAKPLAILAGWALGCDARSLVQLRPGSPAACATIERALARAGVRPPMVDVVCAHGTATRDGDAAEWAVLEAVFGESRPAVFSTKGHTGHLLGACGALEAAWCVLALQTGEVPGTLNLRRPAFGQDGRGPRLLSPGGHCLAPRCVLSLNFGFGGHIAALLFRRQEEVP